jgi:hypothetical protein
MLQVKEAVRKAQTYLLEVFEDASGKDLLLEGVELADDRRYWSITFSYFDKTPNELFHNLRAYRTIKLGAEDGELYGARNGVL